MIDLLVAGGGPVGLAAAIGARLRGLDVVVLEPRRGVLDKACGEGLMPGALTELARLGVEPKTSRPFVGMTLDVMFSEHVGVDFQVHCGT